MTLTAAAADDIIAAAIKRAEAIGKEIGIAVVDADGAVLSARRSEDVRSLTLHLATAKAYSAAVMETPTRRLDAWQQTRPVLLMQLSQLGPHPVVPGDGGIPVRRDGRVIGGVGMSGARGEEDRICEEVLDSLGYELDRD
ncbi:GlcG/HbpS family heme-binding protein [Streptomyces sp. cg40]|uniref:GlcG/HbpS family heme-binding protein n=1 Tax=Streptomyces sp. cg40 TaxID=3419764 RepID=UPI003D0079A0